MQKCVMIDVILCSLLAGCIGAPESSEGDLVLRNVTIVSPERAAPLTDAWVAVRDGRIAAVGEGNPDDSWSRTPVVDGEGRYLTPGLIDSHVHLAYVPGFPSPTPPKLNHIAEAYEAQLPRSYLYFGYTTLIDLNVTDRAFIDRFKAKPLHPDVYDCDGALAVANGYPMAFLPPHLRFQPYRNFLYDPRQADDIPAEYSPEDHTPQATVGRVAASGGICVKTFWETGFGPLRGLPTPTQAMIADVIRASRANGLVVTMHANSLDAHQFATETGVDVIVHGLWNAPAEGELSGATRTVLDATIEKKIGYMPTMQVLAGMGLMFQPNFLDEPALAAVVPAGLIDWYRSPDGQWFVEELRADFGGAGNENILSMISTEGGPGFTSRKTTAYLAAHDARILFGSDTPSSPTYGNPPGYNGYLEMKQLVAAGVSLRQLLAAATIDNAEAFNLADRYGTVEKGKVANMLLLDKNPLESVEAWNSIHAVILHGEQINRISLSANGR